MFNNTGATPASPGYYENIGGDFCIDGITACTIDTPCAGQVPATCQINYDAGVDYLVNDAGNRLSLTDGTTNLFVKATGTIRAQSVNPVNFASPYDYGTEANFKKSVDMSMAGMMRDCAECHVGGAAMEYMPVAPGTDLSTTPRTSLRTAAPALGFNVWNKFIDQYDEDGDLVTGEVLTQDFSQTGVLEMDCLMCHLEGFSWEDRTAAIRTGKFDASRVTGAGLGTAVTGTTVTYDPTAVEAVAGSLQLSTLITSRIDGVPPSANCSSCHMDMHQVDWKKRGDFWGVPHHADVHGSIGCMACHSRTDGQEMNALLATPNVPATWTGAANTALGHDPTKGVAPYSSLWNSNDSVAVKNCAGCHKPAPTTETYNRYGAIDPTAKHAALGLSAQLLQSGVAGTKDKSHIDMIECSGCHVRKLGHGPTAAEGGTTHGSLYEWGTGGAMVDGTGTDEAGRLTDHENLYVERTMENNLALAWQGGKLIRTNSLLTMFWRDKTDTGVDINADGQASGMDAVNPSHIRDANKLNIQRGTCSVTSATSCLAASDCPALETCNGVTNGTPLLSLTHDGVINAAEIQAQRTALLNYLPGVGIDTTGALLKLNFMGVMFKVNHNINPAQNAWGKGGCTDCHGASKGFYNGNYKLIGRDLNFTYASTDVVPLTMVNGTQPTDFHSTLYAKPSQGDNRSIALVARGATAVRDIDLSEALWETTLRVPVAKTLDPTGPAITTRAGMVDYLDNLVGDLYQEGMHATHLRIENTNGSKVLGCTTCHDAVGPKPAVNASITTTWNNGPAGYVSGETFAPVAVTGPATCNKWAVNPLNTDGPGGAIDDYVCIDLTPGVPTGRYTCATACHPNVDTPEPPPPVIPPVIADLNAMNDLSTSYLVKLDAGHSFCKGGEGCSYAWDLNNPATNYCSNNNAIACTVANQTTVCGAGNTCVIVPPVAVMVGGSKDGSTVYVQYQNATSRTVDVTVTDIASGLSGASGTDSVAFTPAAVVVEVLTADFATAVAAPTKTVTLKTDAVAALPLEASVVRAYIYWGDRKRTVVSDPQLDLAPTAAGINHVYPRSGSFNIRIELLDAQYNATTYTFNDDADLQVTIP